MSYYVKFRIAVSKNDENPFKNWPPRLPIKSPSKEIYQTTSPPPSTKFLKYVYPTPCPLVKDDKNYAHAN